MVHQRFTHMTAIRTFCLLAGVLCAADAPAQLERATERDSTQESCRPSPSRPIRGERGLAYGKRFRDGIRRFLERNLTAFVDRPGVPSGNAAVRGGVRPGGGRVPVDCR